MCSFQLIQRLTDHGQFSYLRLHCSVSQGEGARENELTFLFQIIPLQLPFIPAPTGILNLYANRIEEVVQPWAVRLCKDGRVGGCRRGGQPVMLTL